ncbi:hypothetical protein [Streptomyces neyagawaensis]|uniref:hypothetical protein n=1 Tax=Streptomyces neyagawaensis TaxID=42238 RepID=UPI0006E28BEA|nr:hypothetical protein [Streptomyces neyagawaensis]MCL6738515.1 hypothetical protein [Streptomyces neyagawaensis]MDE1688658.1 hypothetical protein [Streptomyces neyagawaensis]
MFLWLWLIGWSAFVLPLAVASLRGWAPKRVRSRTSPWSIRVRGVALTVIWLGGLSGPLLRWSDLDSVDARFLASVTQGGLLVFAAGLVAGSQLGEWFYRRALRTAARAEDASGQP